MNSREKILVVGNGFDLCCGLKSTYKDYFDYRYSEKFYKDFLNNNLEEYESDLCSKYGLIDYVLLATSVNNKKKLLWNDIESQILMITNKEYEFSLEKVARHYYYVFIYNQSTLGNGYSSKEKDGYLKRTAIVNGLICSGILEKPLMRSLFSERNDNQRNIESIEIKLYKNLVKSISDIEFDFKGYIKEQTLTPVYKRNSEILFNKLVDLEMIDYGYGDSYSILNFNYSIPKKEKFSYYNNIHGSIEENDGIIFGIDENNFDIGSKFYKLTKTYKKIMLDSKRKNSSKVLPSRVSELNFFGHSLSEADYSYFQSLFDYYSIYDSDIKLVFYYYPYEKGNEDAILENQVNQVSKLLKKYGDTMTNVNHGKNLLHKLNLEGRLVICKIDIKYDEKGIIEHEFIS